jgi:hypothetical protein
MPFAALAVRTGAKLDLELVAASSPSAEMLCGVQRVLVVSGLSELSKSAFLTCVFGALCLQVRCAATSLRLSLSTQVQLAKL